MRIMHEQDTIAALDRDMDALLTRIMTMGGLVEHAIAEAAQALAARDEERAEGVIDGDARIDALEAEAQADVVALLARHQPDGADLRAAIAALKIAADLERIADYAKNLAKRVRVLSRTPMIDGAGAAIRRLARAVQGLLRDALDAHLRGDAALLQDVLGRDVEVDQMTAALFRQFLTHMMEDPRNITPCMHYLFIVRNLERMGDHVTEICEQAIHLHTGHRPGARPKGPSTAHLAVLPGDGVGR